MNTATRKPSLAAKLRRPHLALGGHLLLLHVLAFGGWNDPALRILWFVAFGLFLIWQPFIAGEQRMGSRQGVVVFALALASTWLLNPWLLLIWCAALAAVIGGRVMRTVSRLERGGYLFAFGYLVCLTIFGVVPEMSPAVTLDPLPRPAIALYLPLLLIALPFFPATPARPDRDGDSFDFFYGALVFLALTVFVLGALAFTLVGQVRYVEALMQASLAGAFALTVLAWAWNPRRGFAAIGPALSRYLLSAGLPLDRWLVLLAEASEREPHPVRFIAAAMAQFDQMPWIAAWRWRIGEETGTRGAATGHRLDFSRGDLELSLWFARPPSPAVRWHAEWLLRLASEFYLVKFQTHELQRIHYLQAVYETGARVTHDVKNLLQSLQALCYAAARPGDPDAVTRLVARQLPLIAERLKSTLDKLQQPRSEDTATAPAPVWWQRLQERHAAASTQWHAEIPEGSELPENLFDSVAENLLQNAFAKRQRQPGIEIRAFLEVDRDRAVLEVSDNGEAITAGLASRLFRAPVESADGLGIGLYHAARQAEACGYRLTLADNRDGAVRFRLEARPGQAAAASPDNR